MTQTKEHIAKAILDEKGSVSILLLQKRFKINYNQARNIIKNISLNYKLKSYTDYKGVITKVEIPKE